jgi:hypothetical protein
MEEEEGKLNIKQVLNILNILSRGDARAQLQRGGGR